jgi:hypothetical protein
MPAFSLAPSHATKPSEPGGRIHESADDTGLPPLRQSTPVLVRLPSVQLVPLVAGGRAAPAGARGHGG